LDEKSATSSSSPNCTRCAHCNKDIDKAAVVLYDEITTDVRYCSKRCRAANEQNILNVFLKT